MPIRRRGFVKSLFLAPAVSAVLDAQQPTPPPPNTPAAQTPRQLSGPALLQVTQPDLTAEPAPHFFTADQFSVLKKLGDLFMPALKGNPGAADAKAPEFLDFLIGVSLPDKQKSYRSGLDRLNAQAKLKFRKAFADLDAAQADAVLRPLLVVRPWSEDLPSDPLKKFVAQVHEDLRTATTNSREWAEASAKSGRRFTRGARGNGMYWKPIDPIVS